MKRNSIYILLISLCVGGFWLFENFYNPSNSFGPEGGDTEAILPIEFWPSSTTGAVVNHTYYSLSYNEPFEQAEWVFYKLDKSQLTEDKRKRPYFIRDPKVITKSADWRNYNGSGYDRGHLCPAGDRRFSEYAYHETFYTSNITPQDKYFNAGIWNRLEQQTRYWAKKYGSIYVITGGILENSLPTIGNEAVAVPRYFYKIITRKTKEEVAIISFLIKHEESQRPLKEFAVTVDSLERLTGIDFFKAMPDNLQQELESTLELKNWKFY